MCADYDLEWSMGMDSNLQWRMGYEPFRKLRAPTLDGVGMGERCAKYNLAPEPELTYEWEEVVLGGPKMEGPPWFDAEAIEGFAKKYPDWAAAMKLVAEVELGRARLAERKGTLECLWGRPIVTKG